MMKAALGAPLAASVLSHAPPADGRAKMLSVVEGSSSGDAQGPRSGHTRDLAA